MDNVTPNFYFNKDDDYVRRIVSKLDDVQLVSNLDLIEMLFEEDGFADFALSDEIMALREFVHEEIAHRYSEKVQKEVKMAPKVVIVNGVPVWG